MMMKWLSCYNMSIAISDKKMVGDTMTTKFKKYQMAIENKS